jgi:hypothetical protein
LIVFITAIITFARAKNSAIEWGELIKSSFDVFLPTLGKKLGFSDKFSKEEEKLLWEKFSQATIYADPESLIYKNGSTINVPTKETETQ